MRWPRSWLLQRLIVALPVALGPVSAAADERPIYSLGWTRGEGVSGCASLNELALAVEGRLGRRVFASAIEARHFIDARVETSPQGYHVVIALYDADGRRSGERSLSTTGPSCRALDKPLSLILALIIDPTANVDRADAQFPSAAGEATNRPITPLTTVSVPMATAPSGTEPTTLAPVSRPPPAGVAASGAEVKLGFGLLPRATPGIGTSLFVPVGPNWAVLLGVILWSPQSVEGVGGGSGAGFEMASASLGFCRRRSVDPSFGILLCAGAAPEIVAAQGYGFLNDQNRFRFALDLALAPRVAFKLGGAVWAMLSGELLVPTRRDRFQSTDALGNPRDIFRRPPIGGSVGLGISVHLFP